MDSLTYTGINITETTVVDLTVTATATETTNNDTASTSETLSVTIYDSTVLTANADNIITNASTGDSLEISLNALTTNDDLTDETTNLNNATGTSGTDLTYDSNSITLTDIADGESFTYEVSDGTYSDTATANIEIQGSSTLTGSADDDILINTYNDSVNTIDGIVNFGHTYSTKNQIGFTYTSATTGVSITSITFDLSAGGNTNAVFDTSGPASKAPTIGTSTSGISSSDVTFDAPDASSTLTVNFSEGSFSEGILSTLA